MWVDAISRHSVCPFFLMCGNDGTRGTDRKQAQSYDQHRFGKSAGRSHGSLSDLRRISALGLTVTNRFGQLAAGLIAIQGTEQSAEAVDRRQYTFGISVTLLVLAETRGREMYFSIITSRRLCAGARSSASATWFHCATLSVHEDLTPPAVSALGRAVPLTQSALWRCFGNHYDGCIAARFSPIALDEPQHGWLPLFCDSW